MAFVKVTKTKAYFKRFQVKYRRRRESKTDYYARRRLVIQDKNKYATPKYRLVVRISNKDIVCQIFSAHLTHDHCVAAAYSSELPRYGVKVGLTNYAAAYATGLLLARRINAKFGLKYSGAEKVTGEMYIVEANEDGPAPFRALLDVGLSRTTTGARLFGALKGAADGGLEIPHNERRFPGSSKDEDSGEHKYDPDTHRKYIFGGHVASYMKSLKEEDEEAFNAHFSRFIAAGVTAAKLEEMYKKAHAAIRADPLKKRDVTQRGRFQWDGKAKDPKTPIVKKRFGAQRLSVQQRKNRIVQVLSAKGVKSIGPA